MSHISRSRSLRMLGVLASAIAALLALTATPAVAAPSEPTMGLKALEATLNASPTGSVHGYFKTVLWHSRIDTIPVDVLGITAGDSSGYADGPAALILFQSSDSRITSFGGIVAGMSGSPIYVNDGGVDKVIGAVSYGDVFTLAGTGLATPIDMMSLLETDFGGMTPLALKKPVLTKRLGLVDRVTVSTGGTSAARVGLPGELVMKPLACMAIGGVSPSSPGYKRLQKNLAAKGIELIKLAGALGAGESTFTAPLEPGASIAALAARGDMWYGGIGTVTYTNGDAVAAFGHPAFWTGASGADITNAWVTGVWPSSMEPYKIAEPSALRGALVQDRSMGILGNTATIPAECTITARSVNVDTGKKSVTHVYMPSWVIDTPDGLDWGVSQYAAYLAGGRVIDGLMAAGSAEVTSTVRVSDGVNVYQLRRRNVFDSSWDVSMDITRDVDDMIWEFQYLNGNGLAHAQILSVDVESRIKKQRIEAEVVDVDVPGGKLQIGDNPVRVSLLQHGVFDTQTVDMTLTIPPGTPVEGSIEAGFPDSSGYPEDTEAGTGSTAMTDRRSVKDVVDELSTFTPNDRLVVTFRPRPPSPGLLALLEYYMGESESLPPVPALNYGEIETSVATSWYVTSSVTKSTTSLQVLAEYPTINYNGSASILGMLSGTDTPATVLVSGRYIGETSSAILATVTAGADSSMLPIDGMFDVSVPHLQKNVEFTLIYAGDEGSFPCTSSPPVRVNVRASAKVRSSKTSIRRGTYVTLTATVLPVGTTGKVVFDWSDGHRWRSISTKYLAGVGTAALRWRPPVGKPKVRIRYLGSAVNAPTTSGTVTITVR